MTDRMTERTLLDMKADWEAGGGPPALTPVILSLVNEALALRADLGRLTEAVWKDWPIKQNYAEEARAFLASSNAGGNSLLEERDTLAARISVPDLKWTQSSVDYDLPPYRREDEKMQMTDQEIARLKVLAQHSYRTFSDMNEVVAAFPVVAEALQEAKQEITTQDGVITEIKAKLKAYHDAIVFGGPTVPYQTRRGGTVELPTQESLAALIDRALKAESDLRDARQEIRTLDHLSKKLSEARDLLAGRAEQAKDAIAWVGGLLVERDHYREMLNEAEAANNEAMKYLADFGPDLPSAASEAAKWIEQTKQGQEHADSVREAMSTALRAARDWLDRWDGAPWLLSQIDAALELDPVKDWPVWPSLSLAYDSDGRLKGVIVGRSWSHGLVEDGEVVHHIRKMEALTEEEAE